METLDIVKDIGSSFGVRLVATPIDTFAFEHSEEALPQRRCLHSCRRHSSKRQVMAGQEALILGTRELATAIAMQHHRSAWFALPQRHQHGL